MPKKVSRRAVVAANDAAVACIIDSAPQSATMSAVAQSLRAPFSLFRSS
jgi:hypothetical protein